MASSAAELRDHLANVQGLFTNTHHPTLVAHHNAVDNMLTTLHADAVAWIPAEMSRVVEEWNTHKAAIEAAYNWYETTARDIGPIIDIVVTLAAAT